MNQRYVNHHCHSQYSNIATPDVTISNEDRILRAVALGHTVASGIEHGWGGHFFEFKGLADKHGIKPMLGTEAYFVKDRLGEYPNDKGNLVRDRKNAHIVLLAKNESGRKGINRILSEANRSGYFYKPRTDLELLASLPQNDVWATTACLGGIWKYEEESEDIFQKLLEIFGQNLFLEVQYHTPIQQVLLNHNILKLSEKYSVPIIAGMDSHMITADQKELREIYLQSRGIVYEDEQNWYLDFPDYELAHRRFVEQGVLTPSQIEEAMENTLVFEDVEEYTSHIFNDEIKLPTIHPDKSQVEKDTIFEKLIWEKWSEEKKNVPESMWATYVKEIKAELSTVINTHMADYFLLNYEIIVEAKKNGGMLTLTSRGSAAGFYLAMLLGFTTVDRIQSPVTLYPARFISEERILETKSLPDVDFNVGNPKVFADAQDTVMGDGKAYRMITYTTVQTAGAWKMYARAEGVDFEEANKVSEQIADFEKAVKYADDDETPPDIYSFIDRKHWDAYQKSGQFLGLVNTMSSHPCAFLLLDKGTLDEEFGLVRLKSGGEPVLCVAMDGYSAEKALFLKNDWLKVTVVELIHGVFRNVGVEPLTVPQLEKVCDGKEEVWSIYEKGAIMGINQVEVPKTAQKVARYRPTNLAELSAFVAAIRPAFKSNYGQFERREPFEYGVPTLDALIQTEHFPYSYLLYQELLMAVLAYAGIPLHETYQVVKSIAKKRHDEVFKYKTIFTPQMKKRLMEDEGSSSEEAERVSEMIWQVIEDAAAYSFNASHSISVGADSLYGAYLKSQYPMAFYETLLTIYERDSDKDRIVKAKIEAENYFGISFPSFQWGQDNRSIVKNEADNSIEMSLSIIKGFGSKIAESLYELYNTFEGHEFPVDELQWLELLIFAADAGQLSPAKWLKLIRVNYFSPFGGSKKLEAFFNEFIKGKFRYSSKHTDKTKGKRLPELIRIISELEDESYSMRELLDNEIEILGEVKTRLRELSPRIALVTDVDVSNYPEFSPKAIVYSLARGTFLNIKIPKKMYAPNKIKIGDVISCNDFEERNKVRFVGTDDRGKPLFEDIDNVYEWWLKDYFIVNTKLENYRRQ